MTLLIFNQVFFLPQDPGNSVLEQQANFLSFQSKRSTEKKLKLLMLSLSLVLKCLITFGGALIGMVSSTVQ